MSKNILGFVARFRYIPRKGFRSRHDIVAQIRGRAAIQAGENETHFQQKMTSYLSQEYNEVGKV